MPKHSATMAIKSIITNTTYTYTIAAPNTAVTTTNTPNNIPIAAYTTEVITNATTCATTASPITSNPTLLLLSQYFYAIL